MKGRLELLALGKPRIMQDGQPVTDLIPVKGQALLFYLARTGQSCSRPTLAGLLWGEMPEEVARTNLRLTLSRLRKVLGDCLTVTWQEVTFNFDQPHHFDVTQFEQQALAPGQSSVENIRAALNLYRGDFLADFFLPQAPAFEEWTLLEREHLRQLALRALLYLGEQARQTGNMAEGIGLMRQLLALEPWHEEAHRQLIEFLARSGQRSLALAQYETCCRLLEEEVGVEPAPATVALYEAIKGGSLEPPLPQILPQPRPPAEPCHNLPHPLAPLVGREVELVDLANLLARPDCRLLTLIGPGGVGKTRLALAATEAQVEKFAHGARLVSLVGVEPAQPEEAAELLIAAIADALNYLFSAQQPPRDLLLNYLADKEILLLLDNFEQLLPAAAFLVDLLQQAPRVKLLLTSRARLGLEAEWLFEVKGLAYPPEAARPESAHLYPAVRLFGQSAGRIKPDFKPAAEIEAISRICRLVEGSPLGLELAASWIRVLSCPEILSRIEQGLDILVAPTSWGADRHQSMRVVLDYSWDLLGDEARQLFRRLSIFRGGFELAAAQEVAGATLPALANLIDQSWLNRTEEGRYEIHELLRQYGATRLAANPTEQAQVEARHSIYYLQFLEAHRKDPEDELDLPSLAEIDREIENLRRVWQWLLDGGRLEMIIPYLEALWPFYQYKGWFQEAVLVLEQVRSWASASPLQQARWHRWLAEAYYHMGHPTTSEAYAKQALTLLGWPLPSTTAGWSFTLARQILGQARCRLWPVSPASRSEAARSRAVEAAPTLIRLGQIYYFAADRLRLLTMTLYTVNVAERFDLSAGSALGLSGLCLACGSIPLPGLARLYYRLTLQVLTQVTNPRAKGFVMETLGAYLLGVGEWAAAAEILGQALQLFNQFRLPRFWEETTSLMGFLAYYSGKFTEGAAKWAEVYQSATYRGDPVAQLWGLAGQVECGLCLGKEKADRALLLLRQAATLPDRYMGHAERIRLYGLLAAATWRHGEPQEAEQAAQKTLNFMQESKLMLFYASEGYARTAETFLAMWETGTQGTTRQRQHQLKEQAGQACQILLAFGRRYLPARPRAWLHQGQYEWLSGRPGRAHQAWRKSLALAETLAMPYEQGRAHYELGRHLLLSAETEEVEQGQQHLQRARELFAAIGAAEALALVETE